MRMKAQKTNHDSDSDDGRAVGDKAWKPSDDSDLFAKLARHARKV